MPILTAQTFILSLLEDLPLPGSGGSTLVAVLEPPDPETSQVNAHAYIVPAQGPEHRESVPRPLKGTPGTGSTQAGWKTMTHNIDVWVTWFKDQGDPTPGMSFVVIMDAIMDALRCATDPITVQDPVTYRYSQLYATGEEMTYEIGPPRATADQRTLRYDGRVALTCKEEFQA